MADETPAIDFALAHELPAVAALCDACFGMTTPGYFLARLRSDPTILPEGVLVVRDGARIAATVTAHALGLRYGMSEIPVLGIANVATAPAYRRRGWSHALLAAAHRLAATKHIPLAMLSTDMPGFYVSAGYHPWVRPLSERLGWTGGPAAADPGLARPLDPAADGPALAALHDRCDRTRAGMLVRPAGMWERQLRWTALYPRENPALGWCASDRPGRPPRVYLRVRSDPGSGWGDILEWGAEPDAGSAVEALLGAVGRAAAARGVKGFRFPAGCRDLDHALAPYAPAAAAEEDRNMLLAILNPTGLLAALLAELTARAGAARLRSGQVALTVNGTVLRLTVLEGTVSLDRPPAVPADVPVASLEAPRWIEVLMGVRPFSAQPFATGSSVGERELNLLDTLFPRRDALFWEADAF